MNGKRSSVQLALYILFLANMIAAVVLGLMMIWGYEASPFLVRLTGTCTVLAFASAFALSATRIVQGNAAEDQP